MGKDRIASDIFRGDFSGIVFRADPPSGNAFRQGRGAEAVICDLNPNAVGEIIRGIFHDTGIRFGDVLPAQPGRRALRVPEIRIRVSSSMSSR